MNKFAFFLLAQFIILFNGYASLPETPDSDNLSVSGIPSVESVFSDYLRGDYVVQADPTHLYGWKQKSGIDKTDLTEEEEEPSSSKKQGKDLHPASGSPFLQTVCPLDKAARTVSIGHTSGHLSCKRYILFEVFRI